MYAVPFLIMINFLFRIICFWDVEKLSLLRKIHIHHFIEQEIFLEIFADATNFSDFQSRRLSIKKLDVEREKIKNISISQENDDFLVISKSYCSIYSINGVLLAIKKADQKFTAGMICKVKKLF